MSVSKLHSRYDALTVRVFPTVDKMAVAAALDVAAVLTSEVAKRGNANAMFATGNSQLAMLSVLVDISGVPWDRVRVFHMDEYMGISPDHPASFRRYIFTRLATKVHPLATHYISGEGDSVVSYTGLLHEHPLDLCVMGIGENGHLAFNDPGVADFDDPLDVKVVELDDACRSQQVSEGHFNSLFDVPARAVTVTIPALLRARTVIVVCPDERKAEAVAAALEGPVSPACPASALRNCAHARLYLDVKSAALLKGGLDDESVITL